MSDKVYLTIDPDGFHLGERSAFAIDSGLASAAGTVQVPLPPDELAWRERWRWDGAQWIAQVDNRGHYWYDPNDTLQRWTAERFDDQPPAGWKFLMPGVANQPVPTEAQLVREAQAKAFVEIDAERDRQLLQPVVYDGGTFDADLRAQDNIKAKLEELRSSADLGYVLLPEQLFWIDFHNSVRAFPDMIAYRRWLQGLALTISARGTQAYMQANQKKAAAAQATSVIDVWAAANGANQPLEL